jgi:hypothetical protein
MPGRTLVLRFLCWLTLTVWVGGFTFYSAVVIPILHDSLGSLDTGLITQRVTDAINAAGIAALAVWWPAAWIERSVGSLRVRGARVWLLGMTSALLVVLIALHRVMDRRLADGSFEHFYPLHRAYLIASTAQWLANLGIVAVTLVLWRDRPVPAVGRHC